MADSDRTSSLIPIGLWFGLLTGVGEVTVRLVRRYVLGRFNNLGQDFVWMAPLVDLTIFGMIAVVLYAVGRRQREPRLLQPAVTLYASLSALTILMSYYPLHPLARYVLAAGVGVAFGRLAVRRLPAFLGMVYATLAWPILLWRFFLGRVRPAAEADPAEPVSPARRDFLLGTTVTLGALAMSVHVPPFVREWRGVRRLPATRANAPNILWVILDTVRAASLSLHGYDRNTTPELTRLARGGACFRTAYSQSPWTLPSHASLFTGRYPHELSGTWQTPLDGTHRTLAEVLAGAGYATAGFVGNVGYCSYESGLQRGFLHYEDYPANIGQLLSSSELTDDVSDMPTLARRRRFEILGRKSAPAVNRDFLSWLAHNGDRPFFAFLNYFDAHAPYLPPPPFDTRFGPAPDRPNPRHFFGWEWTTEQRVAERDAYDGAVAHLDAEVGRLLAALAARDVLDKTLVVIASDHGELFGEHGLMDHANSLYAPALHVPLLMMWPEQIPRGVIIEQPIGIRHVAATILDLLQIDAAGLPGRSLAQLWRTPAADRGTWGEPILSTLTKGIRVESRSRNAEGDLHSLIAGSQHYIRNHDGSEELYDLDADPGERVNLGETADSAGLRRTLERLLRDGSG